MNEEIKARQEAGEVPFRLDYCDKCIQETNHLLNGECAKCHTPPTELTDLDTEGYKKNVKSGYLGELTGGSLEERFKSKFKNLQEVKGACHRSCNNEVLSFIAEEIKRERNICRNIFIEEVDWAEWGMDDEDAGKRFDEALTAKLK